MAYLTKSNSLKIIARIDFKQIGNLEGEVYKKPIYFFSDYEKNNLLSGSGPEGMQSPRIRQSSPSLQGHVDGVHPKLQAQPMEDRLQILKQRMEELTGKILGTAKE